MKYSIDLTRRRVLVASLTTVGMTAIFPKMYAQAAQFVVTPAQSRGPFYPLTLPLDKDNDLIQVDGRSGRAMGEITHIGGHVRDEHGRAVRNARVEIWQCDSFGRYRHPGDTRNVPLDTNFQGYGQITTNDDGAYRFRTIKPVAYPGRTPHIHFAISGPGFEPLVTQMYVAGEPFNKKDFILNSIRDPKLRQSLIVPLKPDMEKGEWIGVFDLVLAGDGRYHQT